MPRLDTASVNDLEILGKLYSDNVRSYHAIHMSLRVKDKASSTVPAEGVEVYMTDCYRDLTLTVDGATKSYQATGNLMSFNTIQESTDLQISSLSVILSGVDRTFTAALLSYEYLDQPVRVYRVFLDQNEVVQHVPMLTDDPSAGSSTISLSAASTFVDFERRSGRKTNQSEQDLYRSINSLTAEDTGYEYNTNSATEIWWGRDT